MNHRWINLSSDIPIVARICTEEKNNDEIEKIFQDLSMKGNVCAFYCEGTPTIYRNPDNGLVFALYCNIEVWFKSF